MLEGIIVEETKDVIFKKIDKKVKDFPVEFLLGRMVVIQTEAERKCEIEENEREVSRLCIGVKKTPHQVHIILNNGKSYGGGTRVIWVS